MIILSHKLKLLSINVRGISNVNKRSAIFSYLKMQKATIFCLQETYSSPEDEKVRVVRRMGRQNNLFARKNTLKRGLHSSQFTFQFKQQSNRSRGKIFNCKTHNRREIFFFVTNIYGPNNCHDQDDFLKMLSQQLMSKTDTSKVIIFGDWNITLNRIDKLGGLPWKATNSRNTLVDPSMKKLNLTDINRELHPKSKSYTYVSKSLNLKSRIDYFLISRSLSCDVKQAEIRISIAHQTIARSS